MSAGADETRAGDAAVHRGGAGIRCAVVTGAARGIGGAIAERLGAEGLPIAVIDRDERACSGTVTAIASAGGSALAIEADVADEGAITQAIERAAAEVGPPTVLVNNAGFARPAPIGEMSTDDWDAVMGVNLRGAFFASRIASRYMIESGWGRIVNLASISALGDAGRANYGAAKAGLIGFTKSLALELGPHGITCNALAPGFIVSDMTKLSARRQGREFDEFRQSAADAIPVRRVGYPDDVAHAASFLVSAEAGFVSGQVLYVAGGPVE